MNNKNAAVIALLVSVVLLLGCIETEQQNNTPIVAAKPTATVVIATAAAQPRLIATFTPTPEKSMVVTSTIISERDTSVAIQTIESAELEVSAENTRLSQVVQVIDGDTIIVRFNGIDERVRYLNIDTPESDQLGYLAATYANALLVEGQLVHLVADTTDRDKFGRLLRHVFLQDGTHANAQLVADGWAQPIKFNADTQYADDIAQLGIEAAREKRGFWSGDAQPDGAMTYGYALYVSNIRRGPQVA